MYIYKKQGCGVAVKEITQYLRIRETRCLQNALKMAWNQVFSRYKYKKFCPPSFGVPQLAAPNPCLVCFKTLVTDLIVAKNEMYVNIY